MSESLEAIKKQIDACTYEERRCLAVYLKSYLPRHPLEDDWGLNSETILSAIRRSSDLTKRGVRGIIAEAVFEAEVLPCISASGWHVRKAPSGDWPFDALLEKDGRSARIQIKLQRMERGIPKRFHPKYYDEILYVVEVQKTRTGKKKRKGAVSPGPNETALEKTEETRPYRFGEFDILAVNMHPATGIWSNFRYTVADWLIPRTDQPSLIEIFQPVSLVPTNTWTDDLTRCLDWFTRGNRRQLIELRHIAHRRLKRGADSVDGQK